MPRVYVTKNFVKLGQAFDLGYTTVSEQGSARSSKTYSNVQWLINRCINHPGTTVSIVRKTLNALKRSVYRDFEQIMHEWDLWNDRQMNKSDYVYRFPNGSWIEFFSCDNEQKMRGPKRQILFVNEANDLNYIEWQQLQMRTTQFTILDYNPSFSEEHWINLVNEEKKTFHFISTYKDNPFLEQKIIDEIESLQHKNKSLWQIYGLGQRAIVEGLVFPEFKIVDYIPREAERRRYIGIDFGYSNDFTAIVEVSFFEGRMYLKELCYKTHMLTSDIINELKKIRWEPEIISESADPRLVDEIYNAGLDIHSVHKFGGSIDAGLTKMKEYEICVTKDSENLIKELKNYTYRQDKEGKWLNVPIDAYNHCFTGDTMVATPGGEQRIDRLETGDLVLTSQGEKRVTKVFTQGCRKIWTVKLSFGNFAVTVSATPDHKFKTERGWKQLMDLTAGDKMYLCKCLMERNTGFTQESDISRGVQNGYIELCGNTTTGRSPMGGMSTTKTAIRKTTTSVTSPLSKEASISAITPRSISLMQPIWKLLAGIWPRLQKPQKYGTDPMPGEHGTANTQNGRQNSDHTKPGSANAAEKSTKQKEVGMIASAPTIANQNGGGTTTSTMRSASAGNAAGNSKSTSIAGYNFAEEAVLESITVLSEGYEETFDIEVEDAHEFFANGVLVHNCIDATRYVVLEKILGIGASGMSASEILGIVG